MTRIRKQDIDMEPVGGERAAQIFNGGSERVGYKNSEYYSLALYYVPVQQDPFVVIKGSIMANRKFSFDSVEKALKWMNELTEPDLGGFEEKPISDKYDVPDYLHRYVENRD